MATHFFGGDFFGGDFFGAAVVATATSPGGSGKRYRKQYNYEDLDPEKWKRKHQKIKARIEEVQEKIQVKRDAIDRTYDYARIEKLKKQITALNKILSDLLEQLDLMMKEYNEAEMAEVSAIYAIYESLH